MRIAGNSKNSEEIASAFKNAANSQKDFIFHSGSIDEAKDGLRQAALKGEVQSPAEHIKWVVPMYSIFKIGRWGWTFRVLMGEGKLDWSGDNQNELVNPNESIWKWKTVEDFAKETSGKGSY